MEIITGISVVMLASMAAILVNDLTPFGGSIDDTDDFSIFKKQNNPAPVTVNRDDYGAKEPQSRR